MAEITASMVRDLREKTDAPMMECKKALVEAQGDQAKAEELLRVRLGNKATRAAARTAAEGVVAIYVAPDAKTGAIVEVNCETDFVAKTDDFLKFTASLAELAAKRNPADLAALGALPMGIATVEETRKALVGRIGENMSVRRFARIEARGRLSRYIHGGAKIGVLLDISSGDDQLGRDLAMHIAASKPLGLSRDDVPAELVKKERDIAAAKAAESGKPAEIVGKMVEGSVQKFLKEVTLLGQIFVKDPAGKQTVEALLKARGASVSRFVLYVVGEGIEKKGNGQAAS
ncbi:MAG TPA: translation elongation factor Ts [Burkholderiales bacterium]|jgi:elongation factor Ts|nr:translation elongation factor Ts [Burkholderiales bacterium]